MKTVILCGGAGTRLWPISRQKSPKQFAQIFNGESLFENTVLRNKSLSDSYSVVVNKTQLPLCKEQMPSDLKASTQFLIESTARNTAPAIALAALSSKPEEILLILPSDHLIKDMDIYSECIEAACKLAMKDKLVTFGIKAKYPEVGFGYIEADGVNVKSFKEKPDLATAIEYLESGNFFWNSGMFCFKAKTFLDELKEFSPEIYNQCLETHNNLHLKGDEKHFNIDDMLKIPSDSIDYAVMEKSKNVCVVPSNFYWSDLGSFDSLYSELKKDADGNTIDKNHLSFESKNNLVISDKKVIATFNVEDLIIIETKDSILVGKRGESQNVKKLLEQVKNHDEKLLE
jgi:mannose-1-phosphate guanylyltransferase